MPTFAGELINAAVGVASLNDTALRGGYRVVADLAERDAIVGTDFDKTGCLVHVQANKTSYERTATGWDVKAQAPQTMTSIYYGTAGDDGTGDGTTGNPFATPAKAASTVADGSDGIFLIRPLDDGPFPVPGIVNITPAPGGNIQIVFIGNIEQTPTTTIPLPVSASKVAGKQSQWEVTTSGFTDPVTTGSHWSIDGVSGAVDDDLQYGLTGLSLPSVSPTLKCVTRFGGFLGFGAYDLPVYPLSTVFETDGENTVIGSTNEAVRIKFVGVKFEDSPGPATSIKNSKANMYSVDTVGLLGSLSVVDSTAFVHGNVVIPGSAGGNGGQVEGIVRFISTGAGDSYVSRATIQRDVTAIFSQHISLSKDSVLQIGDTDFENDGTYCIRADRGRHRVLFLGDSSIDPAASILTFLLAGRASEVNIEILAGTTLTGAVTQFGFALTGRSYLSGSVAGSSIVAGVADVRVGGAGDFAYASLPQNDFAAITGVGAVAET